MTSESHTISDGILPGNKMTGDFPLNILVPLQLLQDYVEPSETERSLGVWGGSAKDSPMSPSNFTANVDV